MGLAKWVCDGIKDWYAAKVHAFGGVYYVIPFRSTWFTRFTKERLEQFVHGVRRISVWGSGLKES